MGSVCLGRLSEQLPLTPTSVDDDERGVWAEADGVDPEDEDEDAYIAVLVHMLRMSERREDEQAESAENAENEGNRADEKDREKDIEKLQCERSAGSGSGRSRWSRIVRRRG